MPTDKPIKTTTVKVVAVKPFTSTQRDCIKQGEMLYNQLSLKVKHALGKLDLPVESKRHHYIASTPGAGKTWTVQNTADKYKVDLFKIQGVATMNAVAIQLATAAYNSPTKKMIIWIDDCDSLFIERDSLSVMKGALDEDRNILAWNKNMSAQIAIYERSNSASDVRRAEAMRNFQSEDGVGISIPTDNMRFIITSNRFLAAPNSNLNTIRKMDEAAIHDRVNYKEYNLDKNSSWGWIAYTLIKSTTLSVDIHQKHILLDWMYNNWERLPSTSMRSVKELIADMLNFKRNYPDHWQSRLSLNPIKFS